MLLVILVVKSVVIRCKYHYLLVTEIPYHTLQSPFLLVTFCKSCRCRSLAAVVKITHCLFSKPVVVCSKNYLWFVVNIKHCKIHLLFSAKITHYSSHIKQHFNGIFITQHSYVFTCNLAWILVIRWRCNTKQE